MWEQVVGMMFLILIGGWAVLASVYGLGYAVRDVADWLRRWLS